MFLACAVLVSALASLISASAIPAIEERGEASCNKYIIISTRGTLEPQGPSLGFITTINNTLSTLPGGVEYDTVYPASVDQISTEGTLDILRKINDELSSCPNTEFVLLGYSQGASATTDALKQISPTSGNGAAVKGVWLIGNPQHEPGKESNIDQDGGSSTDDAVGLEGIFPGAGIPSEWDVSGKVKDVCYCGDGVCSASGDGICIGIGIDGPHLLYIIDTDLQTMGSEWLISKLS